MADLSMGRFFLSHHKPFHGNLLLSHGIPAKVVISSTLDHMHVQGRRNVGRAGRAVKKLMAMEAYEKQKNVVTNYACYCSTTVLTSEIMK